MITEDYVSFEVAKLLKEKGFNEKLQYYYDSDKILIRCNRGEYFDNKSNAIFMAPTLQMAMKWLREVYNVTIVIMPSMFWGKYNVSIYKRGNDYPYGFDGDSFIPSYEKACEAAIKHCLNNLI